MKISEVLVNFLAKTSIYFMLLVARPPSSNPRSATDPRRKLRDSSNYIFYVVKLQLNKLNFDIDIGVLLTTKIT